jgi:beta-lactam-binding protein with PASTA domain
MAFRARVWSAGKIFVLVGALTITYVLFAFGAMRFALRAREVQVPDLSNLTITDATVAAASLGLTLRVDDSRRPDPNIAAGHVLAQEPAHGTALRRQRAVRVWLSAGARASTIPTVTGESERSAEMRISRDGLDLTGVSEIRSESYAPDIVIAQDPDPKTAHTGVSLLVNRADFGVTYVMPDLIGVAGDRAADILRSRGFRAAVVSATPYAGVPAGVVLRQSPQAGFQIAPGEAISLEVSR